MSLKDRLLRATYSEVSGVHSGDGAVGLTAPGPSNPLASKALNASGLKGGSCRLRGARTGKDIAEAQAFEGHTSRGFGEAVGRNIKIPDADYASGTYKIVGGEGIEPPLCHAELSSFNIAFPVHPFS